MRRRLPAETASFAGLTTIGVISDTHGLWRPQMRAHFSGCSRFIHAGDLDTRETLQRVTCLGEVTVVRGNCDRGPWAEGLPRFELVVVEGHTLCVLHALEDLTPDLATAGISAVIHGHTHVPRNELRDGILYFNPGSAGPPRHGKPITLGRLHVGPEGIRGEIIPLVPPDASPWR